MFWHGTKRSCLERNILACKIPPHALRGRGNYVIYNNIRSNLPSQHARKQPSTTTHVQKLSSAILGRQQASVTTR
jgi:hypothetical protein